MWTKRDLVNEAMEELGLSSAVFDLQPEQLESVKRRMDIMMAAWNAEGIRVSYPIASPGTSDLDEDSGVPDVAVEAVYTNLAVLIGPRFGKVVSDTTKARAKMTKDILISRSIVPPKQILPTDMPSGAGNLRTRPFILPESQPLTDGSGGVIVE